MEKENKLHPHELVGDFETFVGLKRLIEGFFNNLNTQELINRIESSLHHPVAVIDLGFYIIQESSQAANDPLLHREDDPSFLSDTVSTALRSHRFFQNIQNRNYYSAIISYEGGSFIAATLNINATNVLIFLVFSGETDISKQDLITIKKVSQLLTLEFQKRSTRKYFQPLPRSRVMERILAGEPFSTYDIENEKPSHPWIDFSSPMCMMLIEDPRSNSLDSIISSLTQMMTKIIPLNAFIRCKDSLLIFLTSVQYTMVAEKVRTSVEDFISANHLYCMISRQFSDMSQASVEYAKLKKMMETAVRMHIHFTHYSEMWFHVIADLINEHYDIRDFCHPAVQTLIDFDKNNKTELARTLTVYLSLHHDQRAILQTLNISKSTLFYRLSKVKDLTGISLNDADELFALNFTCRLMVNLVDDAR